MALLMREVTGEHLLLNIEQCNSKDLVMEAIRKLQMIDKFDNN